ncbi:unnamed protein product [Caenorhabditis bovis]|uniref:4-hydroxy-3-methoxy-5-polyprenylbenzoate decarboxylase n=1 Tax=Caenorhabditis bovis TaxID=2654633 RepID=A0A8S1ETJ3_9PELO|nr:unnamed protein product [Caenorhabditis bovis]
MSKLYPSHIPLSPVSKILMGIGSAATAITDPRRGDMVAAMGETTALTPILENLRQRMGSDVAGRKLLKEKPRITNQTIDRKTLASFPRGTLGRKYSEYRETHDFTHIVLEQNTNMIGEVTVKYFEGIQFGLPMCVTGAIFGGARLLTKHRQELLDKRLPWVIEQAKSSRFFLAYDWENHFDKQLEDIQRELNVVPYE